MKGLLDQLYAASGRLGALFPGRKFTLDGHLVAVLEKSSPPTCSTWTSHGRPVKGTTHSRPIGGRWRSSSRKVTLWLFATNPNTSLSCNAPRPARCLPRVSRPRPLRLLRLPMLRAQRPGRRRLYLHHLEYLTPIFLDMPGAIVVRPLVLSAFSQSDASERGFKASCQHDARSARRAPLRRTPLDYHAGEPRVAVAASVPPWRVSSASEMRIGYRAGL